MAEQEARRRRRKKNNGKAGTAGIQKRMLVAFVVVLLAFTGLTFRVGWIQIVAADQYAAMAAEYQIKDERLKPARGMIVDRNMNELAISTVSYRLWVRPVASEEASAEQLEKLESQKKDIVSLVAAETGIPATTIEARLDTGQPLVRIASDLNKPQIEAIQDGINERNITILEIEERSTRKYPLGATAAKIIGSVNFDGIGQSGIEMSYDRYLSGVTGRQIARTDGLGDALIGGQRAYFESQDGLNVVSTIDGSIQYFVEEALWRGLERTQADRLLGIVYDPRTGDILAMADTEPYDPNDPGRPITEEAREEFAELTPEEQAEYLSRMWSNPNISDVYDPGSPFKIITVASGLEDGVITPESWFNCGASLQVHDRNIRCWNYPSAHGGQNIREGFANSCNPVMMQITQALGYDRFYNYLELFGFTERTGVDLPGEGNPLVLDAQTAGPVGLATMSFGQGLSITPLQMISSIGAVAHDGKLLVPRVVKGLADGDGNMVEEFAPKIRRQVISENTAAETREIMQDSSEAQYSSAARISGYNVGVKTGTTYRLIGGEYSEHAVIGSMAMIAPIEDPQFVVLVLCDTPRVGYYGISTAGPVVNEIASELLRYLNIRPDYTPEEIESLNNQKLEVPDYTGWTLEDAKASLERFGLKTNIGVFLGDVAELNEGGDDGDEDGEDGEDGDASGSLSLVDSSYLVNHLRKDLAVVDQYPKPGMRVSPGGTVFLYWD
ncbi:MAG: penicillin-binding transpeptidase domain-containing protein [Clostridiales bacterium]|nr:penicillin-binding transpeptidase domain-containing protein [Clostridiales bacterium]